MKYVYIKVKKLSTNIFRKQNNQLLELMIIFKEKKFNILKIVDHNTYWKSQFYLNKYVKTHFFLKINL